MDDISAFVWTVLGSAGVTTSLLIALSFLFRTWIGERLKSSIKHDYDKRLAELSAELEIRSQSQLAKLRAEVDRQAEKLRISAVSFSEVQKATIARKIEAVDVLWAGVIKLRDAFPSDAALTDILFDKEIAQVYTNPEFSDVARKLQAIDHFAFFQTGLKEVQLVRPHLGEFTWAIYVTYRGILTRALYLMVEGKVKPDKVSWFNDEIINDFVTSAFGREKTTEFVELGSGRFIWLNQSFDTLLFTAIDTLLTGQNFSEAALKQAEKMEMMIAAAQSPAVDHKLGRD